MNFQFSQTYCSFSQTLICSHFINFLETLERTIQWPLIMRESSKTNRQLMGRDEVKFSKQTCLLNYVSFAV